MCNCVFYSADRSADHPDPPPHTMGILPVLCGLTSCIISSWRRSERSISEKACICVGCIEVALRPPQATHQSTRQIRETRPTAGSGPECIQKMRPIYIVQAKPKRSCSHDSFQRQYNCGYDLHATIYLCMQDVILGSRLAPQEGFFRRGRQKGLMQCWFWL